MPLLINCFIIVLLLINCSSCHPKKTVIEERTDSSEIKVELDPNPAGFEQVPEVIGREVRIAALLKMLGLKDIKQSESEEELRFWFGYVDTGKLVIMKKLENHWESAAYYFKYNLDSQGAITSLDKMVLTSDPSSSWMNFLQKLKDLGVNNLKNYDAIPGYFTCTHGDMLMIEIHKKNTYSSYEYPCFEIYLVEVSLDEMKKVEQIILLIEKEFGYKLLKYYK